MALIFDQGLDRADERGIKLMREPKIEHLRALAAPESAILRRVMLAFVGNNSAALDPRQATLVRLRLRALRPF